MSFLDSFQKVTERFRMMVTVQHCIILSKGRLLNQYKKVFFVYQISLWTRSQILMLRSIPFFAGPSQILLFSIRTSFYYSTSDWKQTCQSITSKSRKVVFFGDRELSFSWVKLKIYAVVNSTSFIHWKSPKIILVRKGNWMKSFSRVILIVPAVSFSSDRKQLSSLRLLYEK